MGCGCAVCTSADARDRRLRPSVLLNFGGRNVVIDTTPDFRTQALRAGLKSLDAVLYTHSHADHIMGMDDIRPFNFGKDEPLPVYGDERVIADLRRVFQYVFENSYPESAIPRIAVHIPEGPVTLFGIRFEPLTVLHGRLPVTAWRFGKNAYVTDFSEIPEAGMERLRDLDLLVLDALRHRPHPTHSHLAHSLELVAQLKPRQALFTHMCHDLGHAATEAQLPPGVHLAYDGLTVDIEL